jgi:hypothetical protein
MTLESVGHKFPARLELVSPGVRVAIKTAAFGEFKLGFGRQSLALPLAVGFRVGVRDLNHGVLLFALQIGGRTLRMLPVGALDVAPPLKMIVQENGMIGRRKYHRSGNQVFRGSTRKIFGAWSLLGDSCVVSGPHESSKLFVGDDRLVDELRIEINAVPRAGVFKHGFVGAHPELASSNPRHPRRLGFGSTDVVRTRRRIGGSDESHAFPRRNPALASHGIGRDKVRRST